MIVHRVATTAATYAAADLTGEGARLAGGRWNSIGLPMLYCASHLSLALLETVVHLGVGAPPPLNRYHVEIDIPDDVWAQRRNGRTDSTFPRDWDAHPIGISSVNYGDHWLRAQGELVLIVPSVAVPSEDNVLLNPRHPAMAHVAARIRGRVEFDHRLFPAGGRGAFSAPTPTPRKPRK